MQHASHFISQQHMLCPQENPIQISSKLSHMKMEYLVNEKQDLEMELIELRQNNRMLRKINIELSIDQPYNVMILVERNKQLESTVCRLGECIRKLKTDLFLNQQVSTQSDKQQRQINKTYEGKVLQLRRLIQAKQVSIQQLQRNLKSKDQKECELFPHKKHMDYFDFICETETRLRDAKRKSDLKMKEIIKLNEQNKKLNEQNKKLNEKVMKLESLVKSKCSFLQYRNIVNDKMSKSNPKSKVFFVSQSKINKSSTTLSPTNNSSKNFSFFSEDQNWSRLNCFQKSDNWLLYKTKQILDNKMKIIQSLKQSNRKLLKQKQSNFVELKNLKESNAFYKNSHKQLNQKAESYKAASIRLFEYLTQRNNSQGLLLKYNENEGHRGQFKKVVNKVNAVHKAQLMLLSSQQKNEWMQTSKMLTSKILSTSFPKRERSNSCVIDYVFQNDLNQKKDDSILIQNQLSFDKNNETISLNEYESENLVPIAVSGSKKNIGKKVESSFDIFDDVLSNL